MSGRTPIGLGYNSLGTLYWPLIMQISSLAVNKNIMPLVKSDWAIPNEDFINQQDPVAELYTM